MKQLEMGVDLGLVLCVLGTKGQVSSVCDGSRMGAFMEAEDTLAATRARAGGVGDDSGRSWGLF